MHSFLYLVGAVQDGRVRVEELRRGRELGGVLQSGPQGARPHRPQERRDIRGDEGGVDDRRPRLLQAESHDSHDILDPRRRRHRPRH
jgi:hypothetical protein